MKLIIYYSAFNISIVDFLVFSEIITSFLDDVNILLIVITLMSFTTYMTMYMLHKKTNIKIEELFLHVIKIAYSYRRRYLIFFSVVVAILTLLISLSVCKLNYYIVYAIIFCILQFLTYGIMIKREDGEIDIPENSMMFITAIAILSSIVLLAIHDIQATNNNKYTVTISTANITYVCNKETNKLYLGKTDNYLFIKNNSTNSSSAIPISEIKMIEFKK